MRLEIKKQQHPFIINPNIPETGIFDLIKIRNALTATVTTVINREEPKKFNGERSKKSLNKIIGSYQIYVSNLDIAPANKIPQSPQ